MLGYLVNFVAESAFTDGAVTGDRPTSVIAFYGGSLNS